MNKKILFLFLIIMLLLMVGCSSKSTDETTEKMSEELPTFTLEELSKYNGQDGAKAYVAVDGTVYDVTDVTLWAGGKHNGFEAGNDLTDAIKNQSPHGVSKLSGLDVVGKLVE